MRATSQRKLIIEELTKSKSHPSADELYNQIKLVDPRISIGTIYRNLEILCEIGVIQKIENGRGQCRFDSVAEKHYHIRCVECNRIDDAPMFFRKSIEKEFDKPTKYTIFDHKIEFIGLCPTCRKNTLTTSQK